MSDVTLSVEKSIMLSAIFANLYAITKLQLFNTYCSSFMAVYFGILNVLRFRICALLGGRDLGAFGGCLLICTVTCYLWCAAVFQFLMSYFVVLHSSLISVFQVTVSLFAMLLVMVFFLAVWCLLWVRMHFIVVTDMAFLPWKSMWLAQHLLLGLWSWVLILI